MEQQEILNLLQQVADGSVTPQQAQLQLKMAPFEDLGFAKLDHHRALRQGVAEVIYGAGKTPEQIRAIAAAMLARLGYTNIFEFGGIMTWPYEVTAE